MYPSAEHAFQAAKSDSPAVRRMMASVATPVAAKRLGRTLARREDWERAKEAVMLTVLRDKFTRHADLQKALCATGDADLVEGNDHGDTYWGVCRGHGLNRLGHLLMVVRAELRARQRGAPPHADDARERARR